MATDGRSLAGVHGNGAVERFQNFEESYFGCFPGQLKAAPHAFFGINDSTPHKLAEDLSQEGLGQSTIRGYLVDLTSMCGGILSQIDCGYEAILSALTN